MPNQMGLSSRLLQSMEIAIELEERKEKIIPETKQRPAAMFAASLFVPLATRPVRNFNKMPTDVF
jgi:hypothetical protein